MPGAAPDALTPVAPTNVTEVQVGIDTGGTFTDAVAVVRSTGPHAGVEVIATAKALTTKGELSIGVTDALGRVLDVVHSRHPHARVDLLSVSTTLATNAVVEGHGDRVGVVLVGFDDAMVQRIGITQAFPDSPVLRIAGGHNHAGFENAPLDLDDLRRQLAGAPADVRAYAVCSVFAVRNPDHERMVADIVTQMTSLPVTLSSQLTGALDATRRASTAVLNARLVGRITRLITAVEAARDQLGLDCPVLLVKGDGTRALADSVRSRPIETVMSGPAASTIGAAAMSGLQDCIMSDVGGTTTDIAILSNGRPTLREDGARVGGWNTLVRAADIRTHGLGGDSEVHAATGAVVVGPQRVVPVCLLADRYPAVLDLLRQDLLASDVASAAQGRFCTMPFGAGSSMPAGLSETEAGLVAAVLDGPQPMRALATTARTQRVLQSLVRRGVLAISALSVTDAAHVLDRQHMWSRDAAVAAAQLFARVQTMRDTTEADACSLAERILDAAVTQSGMAIFDAVIGSNELTTADRGFLADVAGARSNPSLHVSISPTLPIVAVGGPAPLLYSEVGRRLGVDVVLLEHGAVANAVGAALGPIMVEVCVQIEHTDGAFRVVSAEAASTHALLAEALDRAAAIASDTAFARCLAEGAANPHVEQAQDLVYLPGRTDDSGLLTATITATATGLPRTGSR